MTKFKTFVRDELMLVLTLVGVALGIIFGMAIQAGTPSKMAVILLGFPGASRRHKQLAFGSARHRKLSLPGTEWFISQARF